MIMMNDYMRRAEQRLYTYNDLFAKLQNDRLDLTDLKREGPSDRSKDILYRSVRGGVRLSNEELWQLKIDRLAKKIDDDDKELSRLRDAVDSVKDDHYGACVRMKYFEGRTDAYIAEELCCDISTARRNRQRLLRRIAVRLYGAAAME